MAGLLSFVVPFAAPSCTQTAIANGDTRTIRLYHAHTKETIEATYRVGGSYDPAVLKQLNWFLRDWRRDEPTNMDPRLFDVVWEVYRSAGGGSDLVTVMSAYRSPETNAMLRRRSRAVAEYSQHMLGKAMDTSMPGMSMEQIREVGMRLQRGGVGYYPSAGTPFVHLDVGSVRSWPRMSYDQLVRLFPDGKTVHLPSNGQPLARYEEARAEIAANGSIAPPSSSSTGFFAWLFGGGNRDGGDDEDAATAPAPRMAAGRRGRGVQVASLAPRAVAPAPAAPFASTSDDGGRDFFATQAARASRMAPAAPQPAPAPVQAAAPPAASPAPEAPAARPTVVASLPPATPAPDLARVQEEALLAFAAHPAPPRRPVDLVAAVDAPLPPARPVELASLGMSVLPSRVAAYAGVEPSLRRDPISSLLDRAPVATIGVIDRSPATPPSRPATASIGPLTGLRAARLPSAADAQAPIVPPRVDRSNFRTLSGHEKTESVTSQTMLSPALVAPRRAARAETQMLQPVASGAASSFGKQATELSTSSFSPGQPLQAALTRR